MFTAFAFTTPFTGAISPWHFYDSFKSNAYKWPCLHLCLSWLPSCYCFSFFLPSQESPSSHPTWLFSYLTHWTVSFFVLLAVSFLQCKCFLIVCFDFSAALLPRMYGKHANNGCWMQEERGNRKGRQRGLEGKSRQKSKHEVQLHEDRHMMFISRTPRAGCSEGNVDVHPLPLQAPELESFQPNWFLCPHFMIALLTSTSACLGQLLIQHPLMTQHLVFKRCLDVICFSLSTEVDTLVTLNDVLLGTQVKGGFCYSRHVKGHMMFRRNINTTPQTLGAQVLVC